MPSDNLSPNGPQQTACFTKGMHITLLLHSEQYTFLSVLQCYDREMSDNMRTDGWRNKRMDRRTEN